MDSATSQTPSSRRKSWGGVVLLAVILGILIAIAANPLGPQPDKSAVEPAPDFEIALLDSDETFRLSDHRGHGVVVNFWASWCFPCREEMPVLESAWRTYQNRGIVFVGVNVWESEANAVAFLQEVEVSYPTGTSSDGQVASLFGIRGLPTTLFIAPDGSVNDTIWGLLTPETLATSIEGIIP